MKNASFSPPSLSLPGPDTATFSSLRFTGVKPSLTPMSSSMAMRLGPKCRTTTNPSFIHCFSSSSKCNESPPRKGSSPMSLYKYKEGFKIRPQSGNVIGGRFEILVFGKEMKDKNEGKSSTLKTDFMKTYSFGELGEKIRMLRQEKKVEFSLDELNARLIKLREIEEEEEEEETEINKVGGVTYKVLPLQEKEKKTQIQKLGYLGQLGGTPNYILARQYFHPDNMSSAEKLKIELHKLRDEFKMSESDCGSARVQVAQLTTKIKHVASVCTKRISILERVFKKWCREGRSC